MVRNVAAVALEGVSPFELSIFSEVFGIDRTDRGLPAYDFAVATLDPRRPVRTAGGFDMVVRHGLDRLADADVVAVAPSKPWHREYPPELLEALRATVDRGARVLSVCSASFALAAAGLLDGRRATTHWAYTSELAARYPAVDVDPGVLYVDDDPVMTSAGTAAGIDLCLHLVRKTEGASVANGLARLMVVPPHRAGGQAQFVDTPVPPPRPGSTLGPLLEWATEHLSEELSVDTLARRAHMSERTFTRRFRAATGTTPYAWVLQQRLLLAERLLESRPDLSMEEVAARAGFGVAAGMRHHFVRERGTPPSAYRQTFRLRSVSDAS
jgi:transcriptional regulator GlxA family with amidase domain